MALLPRASFPLAARVEVAPIPRLPLGTYCVSNCPVRISCPRAWISSAVFLSWGSSPAKWRPELSRSQGPQANGGERITGKVSPGAKAVGEGLAAVSHSRGPRGRVQLEGQRRCEPARCRRKGGSPSASLPPQGPLGEAPGWSLRSPASSPLPVGLRAGPGTEGTMSSPLLPPGARSEQ